MVIDNKLLSSNTSRPEAYNLVLEFSLRAVLCERLQLVQTNFKSDFPRLAWEQRITGRLACTKPGPRLGGHSRRNAHKEANGNALEIFFFFSFYG